MGPAFRCVSAGRNLGVKVVKKAFWTTPVILNYQDSVRVASEVTGNGYFLS